MLIYKITNSVNGKVYIGQTVQKPENRWKRHKFESKKSKNPLYTSMRKYGIESFVFEPILEADTLEELNNLEKLAIIHFNSCDRRFGYNIMSGGLNSLHSEETKNKMSEIKKNKPWSESQFSSMQKVFKDRKYRLVNKINLKRLSEAKRKKYLITNLVTKETIVVIGLTEFCKENNLNASKMYSVARGERKKHKGFTCAYTS